MNQPPTPPFANPLPVPLSVAQVEQERQAYVARIRDDYRTGIEGPFPADVEEPTDWRNILLILMGIVWLVAGIVHLKAPTYQVLTLDSLEARIAALEAANVKLNNEIAAIEGHVEEKIDAYAMIEANRIVEEQP